MDKAIVDLTDVEKQLSNINANISKLSKHLSNQNTKIIVPQLEETNSILHKLNSQTTQNIILQNDKAIQIEYVNNPSITDYLTAFGTVGAVIISLLLGVIIPLIKKCIDCWNKRVKVKLQYIEYSYDQYKTPYFDICFNNRYEYKLHIKNIYFFVEFKGIVSPIILKLVCDDNPVIMPLSYAEFDYYIAANNNVDYPPTLDNENQIYDFINRDHKLTNKVSPFDKIKAVYLSLETNKGFFKINIPENMKENSSKPILDIFFNKLCNNENNAKSDDIVKIAKDFFQQQEQIKLRKKERSREVWRWKIEKLQNKLPKFFFNINNLKLTALRKKLYNKKSSIPRSK
ncbi:MAG: hypothetical protein J6J35_00215 [Alphaproteobacteria bacterium]|nr:hypothetical protein [Alphaproteobacteria bacterium]